VEGKSAAVTDLRLSGAEPPLVAVADMPPAVVADMPLVVVVDKRPEVVEDTQAKVRAVGLALWLALPSHSGLALAAVAFRRLDRPPGPL
jgi:hypothetical protein